MGKGFSRRLFLASTGAAVFGAGALAAPPTSSLRPVLRADDFFRRAVPDADAIIAKQKISGDVSFALADAKSGAWLECRNEQLATPPASTAKAITALYALDALGS